MADEFTKFEDAFNNVLQQVNANPHGPVAPPPQISAVHAQVLSAGVHTVSIQDNNPVTRGITYHFEASETKGFENAILVQSGPSRNLAASNFGAGDLYWRAYSQYPTSAPSEPVYFVGSGTTPLAVNAGGNPRLASIASAGSGTEPSNNPQAGAGFGFDPDRTPTFGGKTE